MSKADDVKKSKKNALLLGFTSMFTDMSSEMIYPIVPSFLKMLTKQAASQAGVFLGIIEGIAESTASLGKVIFGYLADRLRNYKKLTIIGYAFSAVSKIILLFASFWTHVLTARFSDRIGKSIRTAPRDAILSESGDVKERGRTFGVQRAMDFAGAMLGTVLALIFIWLFSSTTKFELTHIQFRTIFLIALFPAAIGVVFLFFVHEPSALAKRPQKDVKPNLSFSSVDPKLRRFVLAAFLFALGNSSNMFIILRSREADIGFNIFWSIVPYMLYNLTATLFLPFFGKLSDRIGRRKVIVSGWILYALVYTGFGVMPLLLKGVAVQAAFFALWIIYGIFSAMTEGVEKAYVSDLSQTGNRGTALGLLATVNGLGLLPASIIAGLLYRIHPFIPFIAGAVLSLSGSLVIIGRGPGSSKIHT
jgi:MFS family permease